MFELITYDGAGRQIEMTLVEDYESALNAGYSQLNTGTADCFHVSLPDGNGWYDKLPNGSTLYLGRWSDLIFRDRPLDQYHPLTIDW